MPRKLTIEEARALSLQTLRQAEAERLEVEMFDRADGPIIKTGPGEIAAQDFHRREIPGASEYVRVRREDLEYVMALPVDREHPHSFEEEDVRDRLKLALENTDV